MKKKAIPKPLSLSKETLRALTSTEPSLVQGGQAAQGGGGELDSIWASCPSVCRNLC
jgi:hypothetical protein